MIALLNRHAPWWSTVFRALSVSAATLLKSEENSVPDGKVKIQLEHDGKVLVVDEDDVEKVGLATPRLTEESLRSPGL